MEKNDARKVTGAALEERRETTIRLYQSGKYKTYIEIANALGIHRNTVSEWIRKWQNDGKRSLKTNKRGRRDGQCRRLTQEEEQKIQRDIIDHCPDQLKLPFALWTRQAVQEHIRVTYNKDIPIRTIGEYLKRWNFTPQKPIKVAYQRNDKAVEKWLKEEYPAIKELAKEENADIFWGDETGIRNDESKGRSYSPKGVTPVQEVNAVPEKINMISAISNQGKIHFMFYEQNMNVDLLTDFMSRIIKSNDRKVFLILDNLRVHHSKQLTSFLEENEESLRIFYLPSYSPDLNPDEFLNRDLKSKLNNKPLGRAKGQIKTNAKEQMAEIAEKPENIKKLFNAESVKYAS